MKEITFNTREEWLQARIKGIGGSEAASLLGRSPYLSNQQLYDLKTGVYKAQDISSVPAVDYGIKAEKPLRDLFALDHPNYEVTHKDNTIYIHDEYDFIIGSFDGILIDKENGAKHLLEVKTTNILQSMAYEKWNEKIPDNYFCQCLHYLLVSGFDKIILKAQLKREYNGVIKLETRHYTINRADHLEDIEYLKAKEIDFWQNHILKGVKPSLILPSI